MHRDKPLDQRACEAVGTEPSAWLGYPPVSTDPAASARLCQAASKTIGWPFCIQDTETGEIEYVAWIQCEPASIDEPTDLDDGVNLWINTEGRQGHRGGTPEKAIAEAVAALGPLTKEKDA